uniref:Phospholipase A2 n=1 Tax=Zonotrichia albicollis TaxID=44394 RepID=A0A8D2MAG9_ZONAL
MLRHPQTQPQAAPHIPNLLSRPPPHKAPHSLQQFLGLALASCNLAQFAAMIKKKTGKSALAYNGYGCHCGWGGSKQPLDATDRCCHAHDCCYKKLVAAGCKPKTTTYKYSFQKNQITCGERNGKPCQKRACECDKRAVECFQRAATVTHLPSHYCKNDCLGEKGIPTPPVLTGESFLLILQVPAQFLAVQ